MTIRLLFLLLVLYFLSACGGAYSDDSVSSHLIESVYLFKNKQKSYSFSEIQKQESKLVFIQQETNVIEINSNLAASWVKIIPSKEIETSKNYILELNRPTLDKVTAFIMDSEGHWEMLIAGDSIPFSKREISHENLLFNIVGETAKTFNAPIYLKIENHGATSSSIKIWEINKFHQMNQEKSLLIGLFFGSLLALVIFNLFIYLSVRDVSYLWYVAYSGSILLYSLAISGLTYRYFWPNSPNWANYSTYFSALLAMAMGLGFARSMFCTVSFLPVLAFVMRWLGLVITLLAIVGFFIGTAFLSLIIPYLGMVIIFLILFAIILSTKAAYKPGYYAALGFLFVFAGSMMLILYKLEVLPGSILSIHGLQIGIIIEAFLLSFALAYRINYINEELRLSNQKIIESKKLFSSRLIELQDKERKKTSATLHDSIGQKLLVMKIQLAQILEFFGIREGHHKVKSVTGLMNEVIKDVRDISHSLHPHQVDRLTLKEALEDVIFQSFRDSRIKFSHDFIDLQECSDKQSKLHIYRIFQESINNILKHSKAKNISFNTMKVGKSLVIVIKDDGKGVDQSWLDRGDFLKTRGLSNITERVNSLKGAVNFESRRGTGFQTRIVLPCNGRGIYS